MARYDAVFFWFFPELNPTVLLILILHTHEGTNRHPYDIVTILTLRYLSRNIGYLILSLCSAFMKC